MKESKQLGHYNAGQHLGYGIYDREITRREILRENPDVKSFTQSMWLYQNEKHHVDRLKSLGYKVTFVTKNDIDISWG